MSKNFDQSTIDVRIGFHLLLFATKHYGADDSGKKNQSRSAKKKRGRKTTGEDNYMFILFGHEIHKTHPDTASCQVGKKRIPNSSFMFCLL